MLFLGQIALADTATTPPTSANPATTNRLEFLASAYDKANTKIEADVQKNKDAALEQYGKSLDAILDVLTQKGDIDGYKAVKQESKRVQAEKSILPATPNKYVATAAGICQKQLQAADDESKARKTSLLKKYIAALNTLIKDLMKQGKIEDAETAGNQRNIAAAILANLESGAAKAEPAIADAVSTTSALAVKQSPVIGGWNEFWMDGSHFDPHLRVFYPDGRFEVGSKDWNGRYRFTNADKTQVLRTCNNGRIFTLVYDKESDSMTQYLDGKPSSVLRRAKDQARSPAIGKWNEYRPDGTPETGDRIIHADGRFEHLSKEWSGRVEFLNADKTELKRICNNGQVVLLKYNKESDTLTQSNGSTLRRVK